MEHIREGVQGQGPTPQIANCVRLKLFGAVRAYGVRRLPAKETPMNRRTLLISAAALLALPRAGRTESFEITLTEAEWRKKLTDQQFYVLREEGTERAGSHKPGQGNGAGTYHCAGCDLAAFSSQTKYDSGTGWPSFYQTRCQTPSAPRTIPACSASRTEVHCRRCGGHFGHVFNDGPKPTGLRYCMNGAALVFKPA